MRSMFSVFAACAAISLLSMTPAADANGGRAFFLASPGCAAPVQSAVVLQPAFVQQQFVPAAALFGSAFLQTPFVGVGIGNRFLGAGLNRGRGNFIRGAGRGNFIRR